MTRLIALAAIVLSAALACGGEVIDGAAPGIDVATVTAAWSIAGSRDPSACADHGAARLRIVVTDAADQVRASTLAPCTDFVARLDVRAGLYDASATFVAADGTAASATLRIARFAVHSEAGAELRLAFTDEMMAVRKVRHVD